MAGSRREELQAQRAREEARAKQRRLIALVAGVLALVLILALVFWGVGKAKRDKAAQQTTQGAVLAQALQSIPAKDFDTVGVGTTTTYPEQISGGTAQMVDGKPRILYIGAEFCPYCAMDRLSLVSALSRFGTFTGLKDILSSPNENKLSNVPTVSFRGTSFTSDTVAFTGVETADRLGQKLDDPSAADNAIFQKYVPQGYIPFLYFGSAFENAAPYDGSFLAGKTADAVAAELKDPTSQTSQAVLGGANVITAQICRETGNKPANVCTASGVQAAAKGLK